jgi:K+-sensing histidine kinase KdpD
LYKTLFNSISHELRIPVATIMGASDTLLNAPHSGNIQSALCTEIFTASMRLNRVIDNLLNMSRLESGMLAIRLDWYDINDLVNKVIDDLKNELKLFSLQIDIPENMPLVRIDFGLMEQVLYNLLFNATQHAPVASVIHLKMHHENDLFTIELSDKGPGFPPKSLQNVFEKFFRVDGSKSGGLGLGLSIVKGFVEAHKGSIRVENGSNCGALFTLTIPSEYPNIEKMPFENE